MTNGQEGVKVEVKRGGSKKKGSRSVPNSTYGINLDRRWVSAMGGKGM